MIILQISAANGLIFVLSVIVGCLVYRQSARGAGKGDLALAATAVASCVLVLGFLFGMGDGSTAPVGTPSPAAPQSTQSP